MTPISVNQVISDIRAKHPNASYHQRDIELHVEEFKKYEQRLKMKNIFLRMISLPTDNDGSENHLGKTTFPTYHWGFYTTIKEDGDTDPDKETFNGFRARINTRIMQRPSKIINEKKVVHTQSFYPGTPRNEGFRGMFFNTTERKKHISYSAYVDLKNTIDVGFKVEPNYFVPPQDQDIQAEDERLVSETIASMTNDAHTKPGRLEEIDNDCEDYIMNHFDDLIEEYHNTRNEYFLTRADFYRKLDIRHLSLEHKILISADERSVIHGYFLEKLLRDTYTRRIGSL